MIKYIYIQTVLLFLLVIETGISQNNTCTSSSNDELVDLNSVGKCAIEQFKSSNSKEFIQVSSRSRYVRKKNNSHLNKLKAHLKTVPQKTVEVVKETPATVIESKEVKSVTPAMVSGSKELVIKDFLRFDQVTKAPIFITCDENSDDFKDECNKETIVGVLLENMVYPFDAAAEGIQGKVWVRFVIDKEGYVKNVTTKGPENGALLEEEAERLVKLLPKFLPGKHNNEYVNVEYFMPIEFLLD